MKRATILVVVLTSVSLYSVAQDRALISGDAEDNQDTPVAGVQVTLRNPSLRVERTTSTNSDGYYFFAEVTPAEGYEITASEAGMSFAPQTVKFDVEVGETRHILPSFLGNKAASPTAGLGKRRPPKLSTTIERISPSSRLYGLSPASSPLAVLPQATSSRTAPARVTAVAYYPPGKEASGQSQPGSAPPSAQPQSKTPAASGKGGKAVAGQRRTVEASRVPLDNISTSISTVITSEQLRSLPLFNRNFLAVGLFVSSTHDVQAWSELKDTTFSISGQRPTSNAFLLDGMDNVASSSNQAIPFQVNDAIQEFRVATANSDAQFGRNIGGVVNVVTRRGTARFHGSVFGFFASDSIDATSPLSVYNGSGFDQAAAFAGPINAPPAPNTNPTGFPIYEPTSYNQLVSTVGLLNQNYGTTFCTAPNTVFGTPACDQPFDPKSILAQHNSHTQPFDSQQFGAQAGGSFLKRWYWFGDYEGTRINNPNPIFDRVPSSYDRSHASEFVGTSGYADAQFAQSVLSLYPQSNVQAIPDVLEFYQGQAPNYTNVDNYLGRLDFTQSDRTEWTFRYNLQHLSQLHDDTLPSSATYPGNGANRAVLNQNLVLTFTHRFSDQLSNVIRGGFTRFQVKETPQDANFNATSIGLPSGPMRTYFLSGLDPQYADAVPGSNGAWGGWYDSVWFPFFLSQPVIAPSLDGLFPFARIGAPLSAPAQRQDSEGEFVDNLVWFKGRHSIRAGGGLRLIRNVFDNGGFSRGMVVSSDIGEFTSDSETCVTCTPSAFSNPSFDYAIKQPSPYNTNLHSYALSGYAQDTWRIKPNLTINFGLRYEYFSPPSDSNQQLWNYDPAANGIVQQGKTLVTDQFGNPCTGSGSGMNSIYGAATYGLPWICSSTGNGNFLSASKTSFGPRVGVSWSTASGNMVVRAGFGIFYDEIPASLTAELAFNRPTQLSTTNPQTIYGQNYASFLCNDQQCGLGNSSLVSLNPALSFYQDASVPFALSAVNPSKSSNPLTRQVNFSIQREISRNASAEVVYVGNYMANLATTSNTGFNNEWFCTASASASRVQPCDPFSFMPVFTHSNIGYGNYNAFVARMTAKAWHGLQARASYTYSKALDNASQAGAPLIPGPLMTQTVAMGYYGTGNPLIYALGSSTGGLIPPPGVFNPRAISANLSALTGLLTAGVNTTGAGRVLVTPYTIPQDPYNFLTNDYSRADFDQTNRFILEYSWAIPTSKPSMWLNGWMLSGVFIAESGQPFTIFSGPIAGELTQRVSLTAPLTTTGSPYGYIGNTAAITLPGDSCASVAGANSPYVIQQTVGIKSGVAGTPCLGNSSRNQFTGPAYVDYDMAVQKTFRVRETMALSFRAESYNLFNRPNYYNPISTYSLDGVSQYSQFGLIKSAHNPRQFQFAVRMNW
jgi:hypothetical protein